MKLKQTIIDQLQKDRVFRLRLAVVLDFTELWMERLIRVNKDNGHLTTAKAMQVIRKETGLSDSDILEEQIIADINK